MKKSIVIAVLFFLLSLILSSAAKAQNKPVTADMYYPEFKLDEDMTGTSLVKNPSKSTVQYGGWILPVFITDYRGQNNQLTSCITTANIFLKAYLWNSGFIYIRIKDTITGILRDEGYGADKFDNLFDLDLGYIDTSFLNNMMKLQFGRKYFILGTGLVFNGRGDGVEFNIYSKWINLQLFGAYTGLIAKENNLYLLSTKDYSDGAKRIFTGGSLSTTFENQNIYILGMAQFDMSDETAGKRHKYNSQYFGGGINGFIVGGVTYYGEYIYEIGTTFTSNNKKTSIRAMAALFGLDYYINVMLQPVFTVQYAYGSGDTDRDSYSNSNLLAQGGFDTGFISFGTFLGGYALRPLPGNMHIFRGGFSLSPFSWASSVFINRMTLIAKYSYYMKDKKSGAINSGESSKPEFFIGHGVDVSLRWKILSDLSFFLNYAIFLPGDAFISSTPNRHFIMEGISLSF